MSTTSPLDALFTEELYTVPSPVLVVLSKTWEDVTDDESLLLSKILGSVKLSLAAVKVIVLHEFEIGDFANLSPSRIIAFGAICKSSPTRYSPVNTGGILLLQADSLDQLDDVKKKNLWLALKQMFSL